MHRENDPLIFLAFKSKRFWSTAQYPINILHRLSNTVVQSPKVLPSSHAPNVSSGAYVHVYRAFLLLYRDADTRYPRSLRAKHMQDNRVLGRPVPSQRLQENHDVHLGKITGVNTVAVKCENSSSTFTLSTRSRNGFTGSLQTMFRVIEEPILTQT